MANETTATIVANAGHGTRTAALFHSKGRPVSPIVNYCLPIPVEAGVATAQVSLLGAALTGPTGYSEADAAVANTAMNSITAVSFTPATYVAAVAPTDHAMNRVDPKLVNLMNLVRDEISYPHRQMAGYDASIGITKVLFKSGTIGGTAAVDLTPVTIMDIYETLVGNLLASVDVFVWLDTKGILDLIRYGLQTGGSVYGSEVGYNQLFAELLAVNGSAAGYKMSWGKMHIFEDPNPSALGTDSGDKVGCMFVPALAGLNGVPLPNGVAERFRALQSDLPEGLEISPAFGIGYRPDPVPVARQFAAAGNVEEMEMAGGFPLVGIRRSYNGQGLGIYDVWSSITTAVINGNNSRIGIRYAP